MLFEETIQICLILGTFLFIRHIWFQNLFVLARNRCYCSDMYRRIPHLVWIVPNPKSKRKHHTLVTWTNQRTDGNFQEMNSKQLLCCFFYILRRPKKKECAYGIIRIRQASQPNNYLLRWNCRTLVSSAILHNEPSSFWRNKKDFPFENQQQTKFVFTWHPVARSLQSIFRSPSKFDWEPHTKIV